MTEYDEKQEHSMRATLGKKIRQDNPFVYLSTWERRDAEKSAKFLLKADKSTIAYYRRTGSVYEQSTDMNPFHAHTQIPENETNYQPNWKMKLHDLLKYHTIFKRCPIGGLIMEQGTVLDRKTNQMRKKWFVARIQPEIHGLQTFKGGEHWEAHCYHFTEKYHPASLDLFWRNDLPKGQFIDEYGVCTQTQKRIDEALEHETYLRKFYYYLNFWEIWGFRYGEFNMMDWNFEVNHAKKAERYLEKCKEEGKRLPFPYYDKSKDEYWQYRTPNSLELVLADRLADAARERAIYYRKQSEFTEETPFEHSTDLIEALAGDDWRTAKTLNRILATFPDLNKQIISPTAPEYKQRMQLVDDIIRIHPDYAPGHDGYSMEYYKTHPNSGIQEWAWRLGALMNAFGPKDPMDSQMITTLLSLYIDRNAIDDIIEADEIASTFYRSIYEPKGIYSFLNRFREFDKKGIVKDASLTWYDVQFAAINSLLHCDNVKAFYGSQFAVKTSSIAYASADDRDRYLKVMELNHKALYDDGTPLFSHRDEVLLSNLKQIQKEFLTYKGNSIIHSNDERKNELFNRDFIFWNPMTVSYKTNLEPQRKPIDDARELEQEVSVNGGAEVKKEKYISQSTYNYIEVGFKTAQSAFQQVGGYVQTINRCFDKEPKRREEYRSHCFLSHSNVYAANPKYFDLTASTRPENNESITVVFTTAPTDSIYGIDWQCRALLTIDFNDYSKEDIKSPVADAEYFRNRTPNADMNEIFAWIPELKARNIDFAISNNGLLTLYSSALSNPTGDANVIEFLERHPQILIEHYFDNPKAYGLEQSYCYTDAERKTSALFCTQNPKVAENGSYNTLKRAGHCHKVSPLKNAATKLDPAFLNLFYGYSYSNRPSVEEAESVRQIVLERLKNIKHYNIFTEPESEPIIADYKTVTFNGQVSVKDEITITNTDDIDIVNPEISNDFYEYSNIDR